jgi:hypothetical protein
MYITVGYALSRRRDRDFDDSSGRSHDEKIKLISEISGHPQDDAESIIRKHYLAGQEVIDAIGRGTNKA